MSSFDTWLAIIASVAFCVILAAWALSLVKLPDDVGTKVSKKALAELDSKGRARRDSVLAGKVKVEETAPRGTGGDEGKTLEQHLEDISRQLKVPGAQIATYYASFLKYATSTAPAR